MQRLIAAARRTRFNRILAILARIAVGAIGAAAIQGVFFLVIGPLSESGARPIDADSTTESPSSALIAKAHRWVADAARRREALQAAEAARQGRIDFAAQDLVDHD